MCHEFPKVCQTLASCLHSGASCLHGPHQGAKKSTNQISPASRSFTSRSNVSGVRLSTGGLRVSCQCPDNLLSTCTNAIYFIHVQTQYTLCMYNLLSIMYNKLVGALSPVNHKGLYQGWKQTSTCFLVYSAYKSLNHKILLKDSFEQKVLKTYNISPNKKSDKTKHTYTNIKHKIFKE